MKRTKTLLGLVMLLAMMAACPGLGEEIGMQEITLIELTPAPELIELVELTPAPEMIELVELVELTPAPQAPDNPADAVAIPEPTATPELAELIAPTATPEWLSVIATNIYCGRKDYVEGADFITWLMPLSHTTTQMAQMCVAYEDVYTIEVEVEYSASRHVEFEWTGKLTAPDGTVTQTSETQTQDKAGLDEDERLVDSRTVQEAFAQMLENGGHILPGLYLYEIYIDGQLVGSCNFTVLESDHTPANLDHESNLYGSPDCEEVIQALTEWTSVQILDVYPGEGEYKGYVFEVEYDEIIGYIKCYDVMPVCDESLLLETEAEKMDGVRAQSISLSAMIGYLGNYNVVCMTRGQAAYCAQQEDVELQIGIGYAVDRSFIPEGLGAAVAHVTCPNGKQENIQLEDAFARTPEDSAQMILDALGKKRKDGQYTVSIEIGGEAYAQYEMSDWGESQYISEGRSDALDIAIYTRVTLPDKKVYESTSDQQQWDYFGGEMRNTYYDTTLEDVFAQMMQEGGIQAGVYTVEVFIENAMVHTSQFEVLDEELIVVELTEPASLYASAKCDKKLKTVNAGVLALQEGKIVEFETKSRYGDWTETHMAVPAEHNGDQGYIDTEYIRLMMGEELPAYLNQMLTKKERPDWMSLAISSAAVSNVYQTGSTSEEVMTVGTASLSAEHKAYKIRTYVHYSLKEDRDAQFEIRITRPDDTTYECRKTVEPVYNLEDKSQFSDYSICDMLKEMKEGAGILPGSYHYEIWETGSGMYKDGWFELLDVGLALGKTHEDAKLYASPNRSRVIAEVPIYSDLFLYDDYRCEHSWYDSEYSEWAGSYIARVSWNGIMGYMDQQDYEVEAEEGAELAERLGEETVSIDSLTLVYSELPEGQTMGMPEERLLDAPLEYDQISRLLGAYGDAAIRAEMTYASPAEEQLMLFTFVAEAPSGKQIATSEMYVYFDEPGRDSSENVLIDAGTIVTLLERMSAQQGLLESGIYQYRVLMNNQVLAQTQFKVAPQGNYGEYYSTPWASEAPDEEQTADSTWESDDAESAQDEAKWAAGEENGEYGRVKIRESGNVNVRKESNAESQRVGSAMAGAEYPCLGIADNGWLKIELDNGTVGYVSDKMATLIEE